MRVKGRREVENGGGWGDTISKNNPLHRRDAQVGTFGETISIIKILVVMVRNNFTKFY